MVPLAEWLKDEVVRHQVEIKAKQEELERSRKAGPAEGVGFHNSMSVRRQSRAFSCLESLDHVFIILVRAVAESKGL